MTRISPASCCSTAGAARQRARRRICAASKNRLAWRTSACGRDKMMTMMMTEHVPGSDELITDTPDRITGRKMACLHQMTARELDGMFPDANACKAYLASRRWPDEVRCPRCGNPKVYRLRGFTWQCQACNSKGYQFSVLVGTIFENTKIPLKDWFRTIHLMLTKRGLTIVEVQRTIDLGSYRS